jgi:hypothetical protein
MGVKRYWFLGFEDSFRSSQRLSRLLVASGNEAKGVLLWFVRRCKGGFESCIEEISDVRLSGAKVFSAVSGMAENPSFV